MRRKITWLVMLALLVAIVAGCGQNNNADKQNNQAANEGKDAQEVNLKVAVLIPPMSEILELVKPLLKQDGINLEIVTLSDNVQPNTALQHKEVDANFFQHVPYMNDFNATNKGTLVPVKAIYNAVYGGYSKKYKKIEDLPDGATIAIANDPSNIGRSLLMLENNGLLKLKEGVGIKATQADIVDNPHKFKFQEVDLLMLARVIDDVDMVLMTPAYAKPLGLTPKNDALITEGKDSDFVITLVAREDNVDSPAIQKLAERMTGPEVKKFLDDNYSDIALPAFE
ncbi:D-methionine transport system substrate-binding protein [Paenibacillus catalpae]|uniref:Lipoprotein n=2 Tax=Paenibacillus catalpae TaxID=1045775 RepID=A0A1I1YFK5_9BACL|nr:MetQ/NlpA family ABC transporter substrate-binding protein [Paenibacillus catalpae]SFE18367.1 D-methionine transport system substrate-binding protein [Paenibacillus catalpae]